MKEGRKVRGVRFLFILICSVLYCIVTYIKIGDVGRLGGVYRLVEDYNRGNLIYQSGVPMAGCARCEVVSRPHYGIRI